MVWEKEKMMLQLETAEEEAEIKKDADERQLILEGTDLHAFVKEREKQA